MHPVLLLPHRCPLLSRVRLLIILPFLSPMQKFMFLILPMVNRPYLPRQTGMGIGILPTLSNLETLLQYAQVEARATRQTVRQAICATKINLLQIPGHMKISAEEALRIAGQIVILPTQKRKFQDMCTTTITMTALQNPRILVLP